MKSNQMSVQPYQVSGDRFLKMFEEAAKVAIRQLAMCLSKGVDDVPAGRLFDPTPEVECYVPLATKNHQRGLQIFSHLRSSFSGANPLMSTPKMILKWGRPHSPSDTAVYLVLGDIPDAISEKICGVEGARFEDAQLLEIVITNSQCAGTVFSGVCDHAANKYYIVSTVNNYPHGAGKVLQKLKNLRETCTALGVDVMSGIVGPATDYAVTQQQVSSHSGVTRSGGVTAEEFTQIQTAVAQVADVVASEGVSAMLCVYGLIQTEGRGATPQRFELRLCMDSTNIGFNPPGVRPPQPFGSSSIFDQNAPQPRPPFNSVMPPPPFHPAGFGGFTSMHPANPYNINTPFGAPGFQDFINRNI